MQFVNAHKENIIQISASDDDDDEQITLCKELLISLEWRVVSEV